MPIGEARRDTFVCTFPLSTIMSLERGYFGSFKPEAKILAML